MPLAGHFDVSRESLAKLEIHVALVLEWQTRINLVAPSTLPEIWSRHVADSLRLVEHLPQAPGAIADLGSGAGFPGLTLAIAAGRRTRLVESNSKKAAFLSEAVRRTGANAVVHRERIEAMEWRAIGEPIAGSVALARETRPTSTSPCATAARNEAFTLAASSTPGGTRCVNRLRRKPSSPIGGFFISSISSAVCSADSGSGGMPSAARSAEC